MIILIARNLNNYIHTQTHTHTHTNTACEKTRVYFISCHNIMNLWTSTIAVVILREERADVFIDVFSLLQSWTMASDQMPGMFRILKNDCHRYSLDI